jgi:4-hydroxymandelate oxidase
MTNRNNLFPAQGTRRHAIQVMGTAVSAGMVGGAIPALAAPAPAVFREPALPPVLAPQADLVNVFEYERQARLVLAPSKLAPLLGSDRSVTDRITLRPRANIPTRDLDLTSTLLGDQHFAPIIVGPIADQKRFHAEGEVATARGASAAKAAMVVSSDASMPLAAIAQAATTPLYLQVYARSPKLTNLLAEASAARAKAVFVTVNAGTSASGPATPASARIDWAAVDARGVVVSNYRGGNAAALPGTLLLVAPVVQEVGDRIPVLVDGSFRRGSDILKALGFGAKGVLIGRPVMWGLAAYGADGVQGVVEMLQTELARYMCMCCRPSLASVNSSVLRVHAALPAARTNRG